MRAELLPLDIELRPATELGMRAKLIVRPPFMVDAYKPDKRTAVLTMWETDSLQPAAVRALNRAGLIIVPSTWQVDCFRTSGVTPPIEVAPLGFDPLLYYDDGTWPDVCTFGTAAALDAGGIRKNTQHLIDLFRVAFPTEADVRLRVKISPKSPPVHSYNDPRIEVIQEYLPLHQLAAWYRSLTGFVNGSYGEGFGLHLIEAMACGRAVISAAATGLTSFFDGAVGYALPYQTVPVHNDIYTGQWVVPDDDAMIATLRRIRVNQSEAREFGALSACRARQFTWKHFGQALLKALRKHRLIALATPRTPVTTP
jgi:glycosyltransferase involved in cell wall biosynthesis